MAAKTTGVFFNDCVRVNFQVDKSLVSMITAGIEQNVTAGGSVKFSLQAVKGQLITMKARRKKTASGIEGFITLEVEADKKAKPIKKKK